MSDAANRQETTWDQLAEQDPFDAVLTDVQKDSDPEKRFFESGVATVDEVFRNIERRNIGVELARALDFGCGLGRLTNALAKKFDHAVGVDHSANMIQHASSLVDLPNCEFVHSGSTRLSEIAIGKFDFVLSLLVLQHIEKSGIPTAVEDLMSALKPGGVAVFQLPDSPTWSATGIRLKLWRLLPRGFHVAARKVARRGPYMEMNGLRESRVDSTVKHMGSQVIAVERSKKSGWNDRVYYIRKNS
jgi:2-polyprenyl-3-methyl-5-hydroxy-6-metoxy-1,4-benzoquinol methylase